MGAAVNGNIGAVTGKHVASARKLLRASFKDLGNVMSNVSTSLVFSLVSAPARARTNSGYGIDRTGRSAPGLENLIFDQGGSRSGRA